MSQPKRYVNGRYGLDQHESGEWVMWSDYAALAAENERLRKAGDAMKHWIVWKGYDFPGVNDWSAAAKEGRDAK